MEREIIPGHPLADLLRMLSGNQKRILHLRLVLGLSAEETARELGMTPGAVRIAQHQALNRLRDGIARSEPRRPQGV